MAEPETPTPAPAPASGGGGSKLVLILLLVNSLLIAGLGAAFFLRSNAQKHAAPAADAGKDAAAGGHGEVGAKGEAGPPGAALPGPTQKLADFVVHLRDAESDRYARVSFELEVPNEEARTRLAAFTPRIRDAFISYLSDRTLEEMRGSDAIRRTKADLEQKLPELAPGVKVRALYVTDLVIQ